MMESMQRFQFPNSIENIECACASIVVPCVEMENDTFDDNALNLIFIQQFYSDRECVESLSCRFVESLIETLFASSCSCVYRRVCRRVNQMRLISRRKKIDERWRNEEKRIPPFNLLFEACVIFHAHCFSQINILIINLFLSGVDHLWAQTWMHCPLPSFCWYIALLHSMRLNAHSIVHFWWKCAVSYLYRYPTLHSHTGAYIHTHKYCTRLISVQIACTIIHIIVMYLMMIGIGTIVFSHFA